MASLIQGRIVFAKVPMFTAQGTEDKPGRKYIVISTPQEIKSGAQLKLVPISRQRYHGAKVVELPWSKPGQPSRGGLTEPSFAVCSWSSPLPTLEQSDVEISKYFIWPKEIREILILLESIEN